MIKIFNKYKYVLLITAITLFVLLSGFLVENTELRNKLKQSEFVQNFTHTYISLRKLPDIFFIPYILTKDTLPIYELTISSDKIIEMNSRLPEDSTLGKLHDESQEFVKAYFSALGYTGKVGVKYRGTGSPHWNRQKKSFRIKFLDGNFFEGQRLLTFVIPQDRFYFVEPLNMYRAKKLGLISLDMYFSRLKINGDDMGVYLTFEHWSSEWLAKKGLPETSLYKLKNITPERLYDYNDYEDVTDKDGIGERDELIALFNLLTNSPDDEFKELIPYILDMDKFYAWSVLNILSGANHQSEIGDNAVLYFNGITGKFEMIPWNISVKDPKVSVYKNDDSLLLERVFSVSEFIEKRNLILREYISDPKNLEDDLKFYDELFKQTRSEFFKDNKKLYNNFRFLKDVKFYRSSIEDNFIQANKYLDMYINYSHQRGENDLTFSDSFSDFKKLNINLSKFLAENQQFYKISDNVIGLSGKHLFFKNVFIPRGYKVKISAGSQIFLYEDVSIISYSPVEILGIPYSPVIISALNSRLPWGVFAVMNTAREKNIIQYLQISGGSSAKIFGINISGMLAFYNSDVDIDNTVFENAFGDDALNINGSKFNINNSSFIGNISDGLDSDFALDGSSLMKNNFEDNDGDAIDLAHSDVLIEENFINFCGDKGISVGEQSNPFILDNKIENCDIGIAVKDLSVAKIKGNTISKNREGISLYKKKNEFGGGTAFLDDNTFIDNIEDIVKDVYSFVER